MSELPSESLSQRLRPAGELARSGGCDWSVPAAVELALDDEFVAGGDQSVDRGLGEQLVAHQRDPFIG